MVKVVALNEPDYAGHVRRSAIVVRPFDLDRKRTRAEISWRDDLLQLARLIDKLSPERDDPEAFYVKKNAVSHELRRLAQWRPWPQ